MGVVSKRDVACPSPNSLEDSANSLVGNTGCLRPPTQECRRRGYFDRRGLAGRQSERLAVVSGDAQSAVDSYGDAGCFPVIDVASEINKSLGLVVVKGYERHTSGGEVIAVESLSFAGRIEWIQPQHFGGDDGGHDEPDLGRGRELAEVNTRCEEVECDAGVEEKVVHDTFWPDTSAAGDVGSVEVANFDLRDSSALVHADSM